MSDGQSRFLLRLFFSGSTCPHSGSFSTSVLQHVLPSQSALDCVITVVITLLVTSPLVPSVVATQKASWSPEGAASPVLSSLEFPTLVVKLTANQQETSRTSGNPSFHLRFKRKSGAIVHVVMAPLRSSRSEAGGPRAPDPPRPLRPGSPDCRLRNLSSVSCFPSFSASHCISFPLTLSRTDESGSKSPVGFFSGGSEKLFLKYLRLDGRKPTLPGLLSQL